MAHTSEIDVEWGDTDAGGLVYTPRLIHFWIVGLNAYFKPVSTHLMEQLRQDGYTLPTVHLSATFNSSFRAGDTVEITTEIADVGETSFTATYTLSKLNEDTVAASGEAVFVLVDDSFNPTPLPPSIRACIRERE